MTILDILIQANTGNSSMELPLEIIKDNFTNLVNDNYEIVITENGDLKVKIPSLEKRDEYVLKDLSEYKYPLIMCMRLQELNSKEAYNFILSKFMDLYTDKLDLFFKDVNTITKLKKLVIKTKSYVDYATYMLAAISVICTIVMCVFSLNNITRQILILGVIVFFILTMVVQFSKESRVKKLVDAYLSLIKTDWYREQLGKEYTFLCNYME